MIKIQILPDETYAVLSTDKPVVGKVYAMEDATKKTWQLHKTAEALIREYWKWGGHPKWGGDPYEDFRDHIKVSLGAGFSKYAYAEIIDGKAVIKKVKTWDEIPDSAKEMRSIIGYPKSMKKYTLKEMSSLVDNLIYDMTANGVNTKHFFQILEGLEANNGKT